MKFVIISDTHGKHNLLDLPSGDVLIHAGDVSNVGKDYEVLDFLQWFSEQNFKHKIFIAGNHDFYFEQRSAMEIARDIPNGITYLNETETTIDGIRIWGSPISPWFNNWAFNRIRGTEIQEHWNLIPHGIDILITHGPPQGILDETVERNKVGCLNLLNTLEKIKPKFHLCGHVHEGYGIKKTEHTTFINASVLNENYSLVNKPIVFEL